MKKSITFLACIILSAIQISDAQNSVARQWNEILVDAIRTDVPRPTVHSRNLFHISTVMYDSWAAYDDKAETVLLGKTVGDYACNFDGISIPTDAGELKAAREKAISYAAYRLLKHRFKNSPGASTAIKSFDDLMITLGYDTSFVSTDYSNGNPAALGNYIGLSCMELGLVDFSDEVLDYEYYDEFYQPVNPPLEANLPGNPNIIDLNHWQPLSIDANPGRRFLSPQWGNVTPFALSQDDLNIYQIEDNDYWIYHDPGTPPLIDSSGTIGLEDYYKWNFALVAIWSGHLDPTNNTMVDISPASVGNISALPETEAEYRDFYKLTTGGVNDSGYDVNPATGEPYAPHLVPMGDFGRVLAEFWADGPHSETPPGHWYTILNYVNDHPLFEKRFKGEGEILDDLEWDVKAYLILGGAMHDVAVSVWGIKSYYDYIRPISAIRGMAEYGQSSDPQEVSYHPAGLPLVENHIEIVRENDALVGENNEHLGKIKLYSWRGPDHLTTSDTFAGVDWILAENWWPYQQASFITPPFAGYVSGHSTFSRAAAEVMTLLTGDPFFPGGMGVFDAPKGEYLVFEDGPSIDMQLQWATYRDASDQASLSRLWGGIHPPIDDVPGRKIGKIVGPQAFDYAETLFNGEVSSIEEIHPANSDITVMQNYPNPVSGSTTFKYSVKSESDIAIHIYDINGRLIESIDEGHKTPAVYLKSKNLDKYKDGYYLYRLQVDNMYSLPRKLIVVNNK